MVRLPDMDLRVFQATEKELHEPCGARTDPVLSGQWVVTCPRCLTLSHVDCWNVEARCPTVGCATQGRATASLKPFTNKGCPYCAEPLPHPAVEQCPHCREYLNQILLRESLELERYKRCPRGLRALTYWYRFHAVLFGTIALVSLSVFQASTGLTTAFLALIAAAFWKLGTGVREGRSWARFASYLVSLLYILSLSGLIVGLICMSTLSSLEARNYFRLGQEDPT